MNSKQPSYLGKEQLSGTEQRTSLFSSSCTVDHLAEKGSDHLYFGIFHLSLDPTYAPKVPLTLPRLAQWPYIPMHRPRRSCTAGSAQSNSLRHPGRLPQLAVRPLSGNTRLSLTAHHGAATKWAPVRIFDHPSWNGCHQTSSFPWQLLHLEFHIIIIRWLQYRYRYF